MPPTNLTHGFNESAALCRHPPTYSCAFCIDPATSARGSSPSLENQLSEDEDFVPPHSYFPVCPHCSVRCSFPPSFHFDAANSRHRDASGSLSLGYSPFLSLDSVETDRSSRSNASYCRENSQPTSQSIGSGIGSGLDPGNPNPSSQGNMTSQQIPNSGFAPEWPSAQNPGYVMLGQGQQASYNVSTQPQTGGEQSQEMNENIQNPAHNTATTAAPQLPGNDSTVPSLSNTTSDADTAAATEGAPRTFAGLHIPRGPRHLLRDRARALFQEEWNVFGRDESERRAAMQQAEARNAADLSAIAAARPNQPIYPSWPLPWETNVSIPSSPSGYSNSSAVGYGYGGTSHVPNTAAASNPQPTRRSNSQQQTTGEPRSSRDRSRRSDSQQLPMTGASNAATGAQPRDNTYRDLRQQAEDLGYPLPGHNREITRRLYDNNTYQRIIAENLYNSPNRIEPISPPKGLDNQNDGRPSPKESKELTVGLECKVCMTQLVDTVVFPCGHAVLCRWCAAQHIPKTRPSGRREPVPCPVCREKIKYAFRIYIS